MIDKLILRTNHIQSNYLQNLSSKFDHYGIRDKNYRNCHLFKDTDNNQIVTIKTDPVFPNSLKYSVELNPSKFSGLNELNNFIKSFTIDDLAIKRIDHAVDLEIPISEIKESLRAKYKKCRFDYISGNTLTGFEFGTANEVLTIYDKAFEKKQRRKYKRIEHSELNICTRIEVRHRNKLVPFKLFSELSSYSTYNPFKNIEFYKLNTQKITTEYQSYRAQNLLSSCEVEGLHSAIKKLNKHNNIKRDMKFLERDAELEKQILLTYQRNLNEYLRG